jgi:DNA-binding NarL/FixJ family response regulator
VIRLAVVDDHPVARWGVQHLFAGRDDVQVVATVATEADLDPDTEIDLLILDLFLGTDLPALEVIRRWSADCRVLVMSASAGRAHVVAALHAGAGGYVTKDADDAEFIKAVEAVAGGSCYLSSSVADVLQADLERSPSRYPVLSSREAETLAYIARGYTHSQTATRMGITVATVDSYVERIRRKLGVGNKAELTRTAIELRVSGQDAGPPS